jgi:HlyD family secretion protein
MKTDTNSPVSSSVYLPKLGNKGKIRWLPWILISLLISGIAYIAYHQLAIAPNQKAVKNLVTMPVQRQTLTIKISANGTVKPERSINLSPKNAGILKNLLIKEGDTVKTSQVLAYMDNSNLQGQLTQTQGQLAQAQANLQKLIAGNRPQDIAQAQAQLDEAQANLQKLIAGNRPQDIAQAQARLNSAVAILQKTEDDYRRNQQLYNSGAISLQIVNQKRADYESAQAQVNEAKQALALQKVGSRQEDIAQAQAAVRQRQQVLGLLKAGTRKEEIAQARAQVTSALGSLQTIQAQIDDTILRAPFDGVVTRKYADPGSFVTPTTSASSVSSAVSSSILSLAAKNEIVANIAETNIAQIRLGQPVTIKADAYPNKTFEGKVTQIAAQATVEQNVTSFEVKVAIITDKQNLLRSGMNVATEFQVGALSNTLVVPSAAIVRQQRSTGVYVMGRDGKPVFTTIKTGASANSFTQVLSGLQGTETVLLSFPPGMRPQSQPRGGVFPGMPTGNSRRSNSN